MMTLVLVIGLAQALLVGGFVFLRARAASAGRERLYKAVLDEVEQKRELWEEVRQLSQKMADPKELASSVKNFTVARESLKAERGRVTIAEAELDMIEVRLRELEEIHRELDASRTETKEELRILERKEGELRLKNDQLRTQISEANVKIETIMREIELSAQMHEEVVNLQADLLRSEEQVETLLNEIQRGNEQYFILKRRYDALDVEYAQLYQQFNEGQR
jgi:chromosome segregation ATPase